MSAIALSILAMLSPLPGKLARDKSQIHLQTHSPCKEDTRISSCCCLHPEYRFGVGTLRTAWVRRASVNERRIARKELAGHLTVGAMKQFGACKADSFVMSSVVRLSCDLSTCS